MRPSPRRVPRRVILPMLAYQSDPLRESIRQLGRRWTLLLLRDMAFLKLSRFGEFARNNPGLTPRILSRRLVEMRREQLIVRKEDSDGIRYHLTSRGEDAVYILLAFLRYGTRHHLGSTPTTPLLPTRLNRSLGGRPPRPPRGRT